MAPAPLKIKVICRLRPHLKGEIESDKVISMANSTVTAVDRLKGTSHEFQFSSVYDEHSTQVEIYEGEVRQFVEQSWQGRTLTVFAYGPSNSGKTHTMSGYVGDHGIIPRAVQDLFASAESLRNPNTIVSLRISFMELWRDQCRDLMKDSVRGDKRCDLPIREDSTGKIIIAGLSETEISTFSEFDELFRIASARRSTGSTKLNDTSSRSHAILSVIVSTEDTTTGKIVEGKINLIDLAGSESNKRTGNEPNSERMKESNEINKSLSTLRNVVSALNKGETRIPYRNSKLTRVLSDVLGGDAAGLLVCNIAPTATHYLDSVASLTFAGLSRNVENRPTNHERDARPPPPAHFAAVQPTRFGPNRIIAPIRSRPSHPPTTSRATPPSISFTFSAAPTSVRRTPAVAPHPISLTTPCDGVNEALLVRIAALEAKLARRESAASEASAADSSMESLGSVGFEDESRRSSSGSLKGRKRERDPEEEEAARAKEEEMRQVKERMEMLERKLAELSTNPQPQPESRPQPQPQLRAPRRSSLPISRRKSAEDRESKRKQLLGLAHQHELAYTRTSSRTSLHASISSYSQAQRLGPANPKLTAHLALLQEAYDRQLPIDYIAKERAMGKGFLSTKAVQKESHVVKRPKILGDRTNSQLGWMATTFGGKTGVTKTAPSPVKRAIQQVRLSDSGTSNLGLEDEVESGGKGGERQLSAEERRTLEGMLVDVFNTLDVKKIMKLKGVGAKKAQDIFDAIDEDGELDSYSGACGFTQKTLDKILKDNVHLLG
ncbi:P-loop containing nucleoside triphosphate hydrolase protein [Leucosporidium creatinivorum]|uniref:Kinesin-like protein n=1 Tax=Leucosporidium creatinivorum TaxID=106004 RepID=A0A1Y2G5Y0_9BASI|nr:P-loop containing nucleoside triphosphate hydrolase protein [Leucosporidium creatinivorum]